MLCTQVVTRRHRRPLAVALMAIMVVVALAGFSAASGPEPAQVPPPREAPGPLSRVGCSAVPAHRFTLRLPGTGGDRTALVRVPPRAARRPAALVIALHGRGATGPFMERYSGLGRVADRRGFVVAFPSATAPLRAWNLDSDDAPDDVGFVAALIERVAAVACVDPGRVFAVGVSNGGGLAARVGCELSDRVAGIVVVAGGLGHLPGCRPSRPVSVLEVHGSADPVVPYRGDPRDDRAGDVRAWLAGWARRDRCTAAAAPRVVAPRAVRVDWRGCANGTALAHIKVLGGKHQWPGAVPPDPGPPSTISMAREAWSFLARLGARPAG